MALNLGQDLAVVGNIKLTDVELVAGAYRTLPSSSATASLTDQRLEDGQLFYIQSEHRLLKLTKYTDESFNVIKEYNDFAWPSASYALTASYALNAGGGGGGGGSFTAAGISGSLGTNAATIRTLTKTGISGSFTATSASIASDIKEFIDGTATLVSGSSTSTGSFGLLLGDGSQLVNLPASFTPAMISGSLGTNADLIRTLTAAGISGSLGANATLIRGLTAASISGSFTATSASIATRIGSAYADIDALQAQVNQDVRTSATPIFGGMVSTGNVTIQGNLIAQQYIVSSSVTHMTQSFSSGSTIFGDTPSDIHRFTGSILIGSGSISGSYESTASFGRVEVTANTLVIGGTEINKTVADNITDLNQSIGTTDNVTFGSLTTSGNVSGSSTSTGSFGHLMHEGKSFDFAISESAAASGFGSGGGGVSDIVEDTTPQLGGDLDLNSNDIVGNMIVRANAAADLLSVFDSSNNIVFKVNNNKTLRLSAVTGSQPTSEAGGMMYSGSQWFLGTE
tara:strand:- start:1344 stop:2879 length:1536 start_codon:yes stop_codon:yes gene_type:complete